MTQHVDEFTFQGGVSANSSEPEACTSSLPVISSVGHTSTCLFCNGAGCCFVLSESDGSRFQQALFSTPSTLYAYSFKSISLRSGDFREGFRSRYKENCFPPYGERYQGLEVNLGSIGHGYSAGNITEIR